MTFLTSESAHINYLIFGARGQIGRAVAARIPPEHTYGSAHIPWDDPADLAEAFADTLRRFRSTCDNQPWAVVWLAGAAVVASTQNAADRELASFHMFLRCLKEAGLSDRGVFFFGSSAGGVYAGSEEPPFGVHSAVQPVGPYGQLKLAQEGLVRDILASWVPVVVGRIANVYGPTQKPDKPQGLITQLCRAAAIRKPLNIYVPLETVRDYIYVEDVADVIHGLVTSVIADSTPPGLTVEIIASGTSATMSTVIRQVENVTHRHLPLGFADAPAARRHARDLRLIPTPRVSNLLPRPTPLPVGIRRTYDGLVTQKLSATLA
jgi:UDP-glucose 4-epimerase